MNARSQNRTNRRSLRVTLSLALFLLASFASSSTATSSPAWGELQPGPHDVGFRVLELHDHSRPYFPKPSAASDGEGLRARPLQLSIWYPAASDTAAPRLTFGDYVELMGSVELFTPGAAARERSGEMLRALLSPDFVSEIDDQGITRLLAIPMAAVAETPPAAGRFPLLLWGKGENGHAVDHALLGEVLASHGYVVASTPALPAHQRRIPRYDALSVRTQLRDLEFALHSLHTQPYVDLGNIGLLAWSFGGLPVALLQMRNSDVTAIVSFDARIGFRNAPELFAEATDFDPFRVTVPILHLTGSGEPQVDRLKDNSFFDAVPYADIHRLVLSGLRHRDFNFLWGALPELAGLQGDWPVPATGVLERIARATLIFLDDAMSGGSTGERLERFVTEDLPPDASSLDSQAGRPAPPTQDEFLWTLETRGIDEAAALFREAAAAGAGHQLFDASDLLRRSRNLLRAGQIEQAEAAARLVTEAHPGSAMGYYMLAQIATRRDQLDEAKEHYSRCLERIADDPDLSAEAKPLIRRDVEKQLSMEDQ